MMHVLITEWVMQQVIKNFDKQQATSQAADC